tara:strand:- start:130 stop:324 length:195 start_codon:yes stop_codon:yes gene_type:complete
MGVWRVRATNSRGGFYQEVFNCPLEADAKHANLWTERDIDGNLKYSMVSTKRITEAWANKEEAA